MQSKYYVSHETKQLGPYTVTEIVGFVEDGTLSALDYIYDEKLSDWVVFMEHNLLSEKIKQIKPKKPPKPLEVPTQNTEVAEVASQEPKKVEWYVLKGENKFGPFAYPDVVKMLQQGVVYEYDFAWYEGMASWSRIAEIADFSKDALKKLKESKMPDISAVFFRRRFKRIKYGGTILIHDNKKVWKGMGVEVSEGGAGVIMENAMVLPGQELYLHFKPGDGVPPFNAICEVVSKEYVSDLSNPNSSVRYGLKFKVVSTETQKVLKEFSLKTA